MDLLLNWQTALILFLLGNVFFNQFFRLVMKSSSNVAAAVVLVQVTATLVGFALTPLFEWKFPSDIKVYLLLLVASLFYAVLDRLQGTVRKKLDVSVVVITNQISQVFLVTYGVLFLQEELGLNRLAGIILILLSIFILSYKKGQFKLNKYIALNFLSRLAFAIAISIDVGISGQFNFPFYISLTLLIPAIIILLVERLKLIDLVEEFHILDKRYALIVGVSWIFFIIFFIKALQLGEFSVVSPLAGTSVLINSVVAYIFLKERGDFLKKIASAVVVMLGIFLLTSGL